jgi:sulfatase modifying factor 1
MIGRQTHRPTIGTFLVLAMLAAVGCNGATEETAALPTIKTKSGVEMVVIPAGSFQMGNAHGSEEEKPVHKVSVDSFLMDKYAVMQAEFEKLGEDADPPFANPSHFKGANLPAEMVTWREAARFCNARSLSEGLKPCYNDKAECDFDADGFRLPTEAEWEYACRAGTSGDYSFGHEAKQLADFAWFADNSAKKTHSVGDKRPNPWGLYDMHGNVLQWCNDIYDKTYYKNSPDTNPHGPAKGKEYVLRGGSWKAGAEELRSSYRLGGAGGFSDACLARDDIGFRCVRKAPEK